MIDNNFKHNIRFIRNILLALLFIVIFFLLHQLSSLLLPLVLAALFALLFLPIVQVLRKIRIPNWIIVPCIGLLTLGLLFAVANIVINTIQEIMQQQDYLVEQFIKRIDDVILLINDNTSLSMESESVLDYIDESLNKENITLLAKGTARGLGSFGSSFLIFGIYYILLLAGIANYKQYLAFVGGKQKNLVDTATILQKTISTYMGIKTIISLVTGFIAGLICFIMGVKFYLFWGFLTFILNYIPSIGSILATIPPVILGFIQFNSISRVLILLTLLTSIQMTIGNFLDPMIMGDRLRLNTVTVIFGLLFWGFIWGVPGMLLSVPLMVIIKVILEKSESWSMVARAMASSDRLGKKRRLAYFKRRKRRDKRKNERNEDQKDNKKEQIPGD